MTPSNPVYFQFEADFVESLRCIPMQVRYKLDTCGVKLKLHHWHQFFDRGAAAVSLPPLPPGFGDQPVPRLSAIPGSCPHRLPGKGTGHRPHSPLGRCHPDSFKTCRPNCRKWGPPYPLSSGSSSAPLQRFALIKLSRPSHENRNFPPRSAGIWPVGK